MSFLGGRPFFNPDFYARRPDENAKIKCGNARFDSLLTKVDFKVVTSAAEV